MTRNNNLEKEEFNKKVKKNIKKIILIIIIALIIGYIINKIYVNYIEKLYIERDRVSYTNENIIREYISYLHDVNQLVIDMICGIEVDKEYYETFLQFNREKFDNLRMITYNRDKYPINKLENFLFEDKSYFHQDSNWCIRGLLLEEEITKEQKEYLLEIYKVNNKIREVYYNNLKSIYVDQKKDKDIFYELYYDGRMYYDLINRLYEATEGKSYDIPTKLDIIPEYPEKEIREEDKLSKTSLEYAEILSEIITDEKAKFTVSNEGRDLKYTLENDTTKHITIAIENDYSLLSYYDEDITQGEMSEELIDKKAEEIISEFNVDLLKLVEKKYDDYFTSRQGKSIKFYGYEYMYYIIDGNYIDLSSLVRIIILNDGTVHEIQVNNLNIVDGTYKKITPKLTMKQAESMLDDEIKQNIKSYRLIRISDDLMYEIEFSFHDISLYAEVNADTGEIVDFKDTSHRSIVE